MRALPADTTARTRARGSAGSQARPGLRRHFPQIEWNGHSIAAKASSAGPFNFASWEWRPPWARPRHAAGAGGQRGCVRQLQVRAPVEGPCVGPLRNVWVHDTPHPDAVLGWTPTWGCYERRGVKIIEQTIWWVYRLHRAGFARGRVAQW